MKKPAKIEDDCLWVSVVSVETSSGVRATEMAWGMEYVMPLREARVWPERAIVDRQAEESALVWYRETDQCTDAEITSRLENAKGFVMNVAVRLCPIVKSRVTRQEAVRA